MAEFQLPNFFSFFFQLVSKSEYRQNQGLLRRLSSRRCDLSQSVFNGRDKTRELLFGSARDDAVHLTRHFELHGSLAHGAQAITAPGPWKWLVRASWARWAGAKTAFLVSLGLRWCGCRRTQVSSSVGAPSPRSPSALVFL